MTYHIGDIVGMDEYPEAVAWCDENNATLTEIDPVDRDVEETYTEQVPVESEIVVPAIVHIEETPVSYTDESGNIIEKIETETVIDVPEHTEKVVEYTDVEKTRIVKKTFRQFRIDAIPQYVPTYEDQKRNRSFAYTNEVDPITAHINRLRDEEQTEEIIAKIEELKSERAKKVEEIKERYPYPEGMND